MELSPRQRRRLIAAFVCVALFALVGFFVLPPIVKAQLEKRASAELGRTVTVERVRLNPFALSLTLEKFDIKEKDGRDSFIGWDRLYVNFEALASLTGDWVLGDVELEGFRSAVAIKTDGSFNFSDLVARLKASSAASPAAEKKSRPIRVGKLQVTQARVNFTDQSHPHPFTSVIGPLTFTLTEFRTAGEHGAPYRFNATTEAGEKLAWTGTLSADPLASRGEFAVEDLVLKKYTPYFEDKLHADVTAGTLTIRGRYEANLAANHRTLKLADGEVHLWSFHANERVGGPSVLDLPALDVVGIQADAVTLQGSVTRVGLSGGQVAVRREQDGSLNVLALVSSSPASAPSAPATPRPAAPPAKLPVFMIGEISLQDFAIEVTDLAATRAAQLALTHLQTSLKNVTLAEGATIPVGMSFDWTPQGKVQVTGNLRLKPTLTADLKADVTGLEILPLSPYLEQFINARVTQGAVSTSSQIHLEMAGNEPQITLVGGLEVNRFGLVDGTRSEELAGFSRLAFTGLNVGTAPQLTVKLDEVSLAGPYARVVVNADQSINLAGLARPGAEHPASAPALPADASNPSAPEPAPKIEIGRVVLEGGDFSVTDNSVEPRLHVALNQFGGTIAHLASENLARGDVDLKGAVDGAGPVAITGKLDPLGATKFVDLKIDFKNIDLVAFSPYAGKFAGYEIARGHLVFDSKFVLDGKKVDSTNVVTLHQFTFGAATNSPDATTLPVRLGVALLKDTDGKIEIDLPVQGTFDDPNFRVRKVVLRVIVNLLTKAATSPFSLLGAMFGGGGEELAFQQFEPGSSTLLPSEATKMETLVRALTNRPGLSLGLEGRYDAAADRYALKQRKLEDQVRRAVWTMRHARDPNIAPPEQLTIPPEEHAAMVKQLFDAAFPPGTEFGTPLEKAPAVAAPPAAAVPAGFFKRIVNAMIGKDRPGASADKSEKPTKASTSSEDQKTTETVTAAGLPPDQMAGRLTEKIAVTEDDLRALATSRAQQVRDRLVERGIAADRLFLTQAKEAPKENQGPRVLLSLQ
jgi:hypothetical protein